MSGKWIIIIFICACATTALTSSAYHPRQIQDKWNFQNSLYNSEKEIEDDVETMTRSKREGDAKRVVSIPETVLSVQYDKGFLKELRLSQGAGGLKENSEWSPSIVEKAQICEDLCRAGLGGEPCGFSCLDRMPAAIKNSTIFESRFTKTTVRIQHNRSTTKRDDKEINIVKDDEVGNPRDDVCPALCQNKLGDPLCGCKKAHFGDSTSWFSVCEAFCSSDAGSYRVNGCPPCDDHQIITDTKTNSFTSEIWEKYCKEQCRTGNGGAACNCDKFPFSIKQ